MKCGHQELLFDKPKVMGILNLTPDSFYTGSRFSQMDEISTHVEKMLMEGASIIDIGAVSSRPGASLASEEDEMKRIIPVLKALVKQFPDTIFSVDTFRASIANAAYEAGAGMINDISGGHLDPNLLRTVAETGLPYVLMHMHGNPTNMQQNPIYENIIPILKHYFETSLEQLYEKGMKDVIIDPGFGFGKTIEQNYTLLNHLPDLRVGNCLLLVGLSRKSMIYKLLQITPEEALNGTSALHLLALLNGANILRVHDVKEAIEIVKLAEMLEATKLN